MTVEAFLIVTFAILGFLASMAFIRQVWLKRQVLAHPDSSVYTPKKAAVMIGALVGGLVLGVLLVSLPEVWGRAIVLVLLVIMVIRMKQLRR